MGGAKFIAEAGEATGRNRVKGINNPKKYAGGAAFDKNGKATKTFTCKFFME